MASPLNIIFPYIFQQWQNAPLHFAAQNGQLKMVELLASNDADLDARNLLGTYTHCVTYSRVD